MRVRTFNVPPQKILTKDQAAVLVGADVQFMIKDPVASKGVVQDLNHSMRVLTQTTLVNIMMTQKVVKIQNDKKFIGIHTQDELNKATKSWGVQIHRIEISEPQVICAPPEFNPDLSSMFKGYKSLESWLPIFLYNMKYAVMLNCTKKNVVAVKWITQVKEDMNASCYRKKKLG